LNEYTNKNILMTTMSSQQRTHEQGKVIQ